MAGFCASVYITLCILTTVLCQKDGKLVYNKLIKTSVKLECAEFDVNNDSFSELSALRWKFEDDFVISMSITTTNGSTEGIVEKKKNESHYVFDPETGTLRIRVLRVSDSGLYECILYKESFVTSGDDVVSKVQYELNVYDAPGSPKMVHELTYAIDSTAINVSWIPPSNQPIEITGYDVIADPLHSPKLERHVAANTTYAVFTNLTAYTTYFVAAAACIGDLCSTPSEQVLITTHEDLPSKPSLLPINNRTSHSIYITWTHPERINGLLRGYLVYWREKIVQDLLGKPHMHNLTHLPVFYYVIPDLKPWTDYRIYIKAYNNAGESDASDYKDVSTDFSAPSEPRNVSSAAVNSTAIKVTWIQPLSFTVNIDRYKICHGVRSSSGGHLQPNRCYFKQKQFAQNMVYNEFVIGELEPGTTYMIDVQAITDSWFSRLPLYGPSSVPTHSQTHMAPEPHSPKPNNDKVLGAIVGVVITGTILICLIIGFLFVRRHVFKNNRRYAEVNQNGPDSIGLNDVYGNSVPLREDIPVSQFSGHVSKNHANGDLIFSQEFDDINQSSRTDLAVKHSLDPENRIKNRYVNILAYDHSRLILRPLSGQHGDPTYINANYIEGYHKPRSFIATQGPLTQTTGDFWRMVWEQNTAVIVMITNLTERGRRKCDQYWPTDGESIYGYMNVKLLSESVTAHYTLRKFMLKHVKDARISVRKRASAERVIHQFHFTEWPDHGVPDFALPVLQYLKRSIAALPEGSGPPVVHCSAGVGRTGTYIVIDSMMKQILDKDSLNVYSFLTHIRQQRNYMVQTEEQYIFIHDVLLEYIESGDTEVQGSNLTQYILDLQEVLNRTASKLEQQYQRVVTYQAKDFELITANMDVNKPKNRSKKILPVEISRVKLPMNPGILGSDYINASYLQGRFKKEEYIVTQHPLKSTVEDFWRMVWDQNTMTVVLLSDVDSQDYVEFWPEKDETIQYTNFTMTYINETQEGSHVCRDFLLQSTQDDYECTTRLISPTDSWPDKCTPLNSAFELVHSVKQWHSQHEVEGPIVVIDRFGGKEAATFCILSTLQDQLEQDNCVDVYLNAKLYHLKRPGIFSSQESYLFIYRALEALCTEEHSHATADKDSGISNCNNYRGSLPPGLLHDLPPPAVIRSSSRNSAIRNDSPGAINRTSTL